MKYAGLLPEAEGRFSSPFSESRVDVRRFPASCCGAVDGAVVAEAVGRGWLTVEVGLIFAGDGVWFFC